SQSLLQPAYQLELLDAYGNLDELRAGYVALAQQVRELRTRHAQLLAERQQRQRELSLLEFEREELHKAHLRSGEGVELGRQRERLANAQALQEFAAKSCSLLYDADGSVVEQLGKLRKEMQNWSRLDPELEEVARRLDSVLPEVQDLAETIRALGQRW